MKKNNCNDAWGFLLDKYDIENKVKKDGLYHIKASEIKEVKEPRIMAKWDSSKSLPEKLKKSKLNILPDSRSSYVISDFKLYEKFPEFEDNISKMTKVELPYYETIDVNNIRSESNAINVLILSGILDDFLDTRENVETFNGRMGVGEFEFDVDSFSGGKRHIKVKNAQCEIDGGFENENSVIIMEAKNVVYDDFHIRQLYYPYRYWKNRVKKPIRLVFSVYSNMIFRLYEYQFRELDNYSSIELVNAKNYSLQDTTITMDELLECRNKVKIKATDKHDKTPFPQADSMDRIISLLENIYNNPMSMPEIADLMQFRERQSRYYYNAGKYLGLFVKKRDDVNRVFLTRAGEQIHNLNYKDRQLKIVELILKNKVFSEIFDQAIKTGSIPDKKDVINVMRRHKVCSENLVERRSSTVISWVKWIFNLTNI